jgi:hypothetical protein
MISKYELALTEIRNNFRLQCEGMDACKQSARSSLNSSGLIIALISLLGTLTDNKIDILENKILFYSWLFTILIFIGMVISYVLVIKPIELRAPIKSSKENFDEVFFNQDDEKCFKIIIDKYIKTIDGNSSILLKASKLATWSNYLAALSIISAFFIFVLSILFI